MKKRKVSLIVPAYKQEKTIQQDIQQLQKVLNSLNQEYEIIVVVDGSKDKTLQNAKKVKSSRVSILNYDKNKGKGYAVRYGMSKASGDIVGFIDAGMDLNPKAIALMLGYFDTYNADIVIGSKRHSSSKVNYPLFRRVISLLSQMFIKTLFGLYVRDTQVGMKFFKSKVIDDVLPRLLVKKFAFDIEILVVAYHLGYTRIYEAPIELKFNFTSSISQNVLNALFRTLWDTLAIFYRLHILHYYDRERKLIV